MREIKIGNRKIGNHRPVFIVAELSSNHRQKFSMAVAMVKAAARAGADAVKLQTYTPQAMTINSSKKWFWISASTNPKIWQGQTLYELYQKAYTPWEWHAKLQKLAHGLGLAFFSTPFDATAVDFLEKLKVPVYKIASYEVTDIPLIRKVAKTGKPVILSVGFATIPEIKLAVSTLRRHGTKDLVILHCTTSYTKAAHESSTNLRTMVDLGKKFKSLYGFSDNMGGIKVPALAAAMGASVIEKHLVVKHNPKVLDDRFSLDESQFSRMVQLIRWQEKVMGKIQYGPRSKEEFQNRRYRRSIFVASDIKKGQKFSLQNIRVIRPGFGLKSKYYEKILGMRASRDLEAGTPLTWKMVRKH